MSGKSFRLNGSYGEAIKQIADELLWLGDDYGRLFAAAGRFHTLLSEMTGLEDKSEHSLHKQETLTPTGKAISAVDAARCVLDFQRTTKFTRGLHAAIKEAARRFTRRPIEVLYAGCGPFAPFAVAMSSQFHHDEVRFTLLDIHHHSLLMAEKIFRLLGCPELVHGYVKCDAAAYRHPGNFHVIIAESMQMALEKEPQVAIALNLIPQLTEGGIFVPEKITVDVCLASMKQAPIVDPHQTSETGTIRIDLGRIFELSAANEELRQARNMQSPPISLPPVTIRIPRDADPRLHVMLATGIHVHDSIALCDYESGITYPKFLIELDPPQPEAQIEFTYILSQAPGFRYRLIPSEKI